MDNKYFSEKFFEEVDNSIVNNIEPNIIDYINLYNHNFFQYYVKQIFNKIQDKLDENILFKLQYLVEYNIIYINCKFEHIIDFGIIEISFNYEFNEYVLSLILYSIPKKKIKKIDIKISTVIDDAYKIIKALDTISEYILYDYLYVKLS